VKKHHGDGHITFKSEAKNTDEMEHCLEFARGLGYSSPTPKNFYRAKNGPLMDLSIKKDRRFACSIRFWCLIPCSTTLSFSLSICTHNLTKREFRSSNPTPYIQAERWVHLKTQQL